MSVFEVWFRYLFFAGLTLAATCGCTRAPQMCEVTGTVSYREQAIDEGQIIFADVAQRGPTAAAPIVKGNYLAKVWPGEKTVRITANKPTGRMLPGAMGVPLAERIDIVPQQYNTASKLIRTIEPQAAMSLDFKLD